MSRPFFNSVCLKLYLPFFLFSGSELEPHESGGYFDQVVEPIVRILESVSLDFYENFSVLVLLLFLIYLYVDWAEHL